MFGLYSGFCSFRGEQEEVAQESLPDDLDQSPNFDPTEPGPIPNDKFDQSWGA